MLHDEPEWAFTVARFSVALVCTWPPKINASKLEMFIFDIKWWLSWMSMVLLGSQISYAAYTDRHDILLATKSLCFTTFCIKCNAQMLICKILRKRMQTIIYEMENHVHNAAPEERELFLHYTKSRGIFYVRYNIFTMGACLGILLGPLILPQPLPSDAKYPFRVDQHPIFEIVYIQHIIVGIQIVSGGAIDGQMAMMLWYVIIRLKVLEAEIRKIQNANDFSICIQKHQYLLGLAKEIIYIVRYVLLTTAVVATMSIIFGGVHIVGNQPIIVRVQFVLIVLVFSLVLLLTAWPSEILIRSCEGIGTAIYESAWTKSSFSKSVTFVIQRSNQPAVITVAGLLPKLSLNYYATFLSKTLSFFTTLRVVLAKMETTDLSASVQDSQLM